MADVKKIGKPRISRRCETLLVPLNERRMRACGKQATKFVRGKWRCDRCAQRVKDRIPNL